MALRRAHRIFVPTLVLGLLAAAAVAMTPATPASAIGSTDLLIESAATFSNPLRPNQTATPPCVRYGTGDPVTFTGGAGNLTQAEQGTTAGSHNEVHAGGTILSPTTCFPNPSDSSGLGFTGVTAPMSVGPYFELGRFFHYNRTVGAGSTMHWADLAAAMTFTNPVTGAAETLDASYRIEVQESSELYNLGPTATVSPTQCEFAPGKVNTHAPHGTTTGPVVPTWVGALNVGPYSVGTGAWRVDCADSVYLTSLTDGTGAAPTLQWGETSVAVNIAGWAYLDGSGQCDASNMVTGALIYTAEGSDNELCLLGSIAPASVTVTKALADVDDNTFSFELVEQDQTTPTLVDVAGNAHSFQIDTAAASTHDAGAVEPGLYRLTEVNLPTGYELADVECVDGAGMSVLTPAGLLDLDSGVAASCTVTNRAVTTAGLTLVKTVAGGDADPAAWTLTATGADGVALTGTTGATARVAPGTYGLSESGGIDGYSLTGLDCVDAAAQAVPVSGSAITLAAGDEVTCTFTNTADPTAQLTLIKTVTGGDADASEWTLTATGPDTLSGTTGVTGTVAAGVYTLTEADGSPDYALTNLVCADAEQHAVPVTAGAVTLAGGDAVTCTFTNTFSVPPLPATGSGSSTGGLPATGGNVEPWPLWVGGGLLLVGIALVALRRRAR